MHTINSKRNARISLKRYCIMFICVTDCHYFCVTDKQHQDPTPSPTSATFQFGIHAPVFRLRPGSPISHNRVTLI